MIYSGQKNQLVIIFESLINLISERKTKLNAKETSYMYITNLYIPGSRQKLEKGVVKGVAWVLKESDKILIYVNHVVITCS
jgi:hypothetical protein